MSNVLSFDRLKAGLSQIQNLGLIEEDVTIHGMHFRIRTLRASEHKKVNEFVADYMEQYEGEEDTGFPLDATMDFFTVRKIEPLAHAILELGDLDFRGIEFIENGDYDQNGNPVKIEKHVFLRRMMYDMDVTVIDTLHSKYIDLIQTAEEKAAEKVEFRNPEEELERVEARRRELLKELGREEELQEAVAEETNEGAAQLTDAGGDEIDRELRNAVFQKIDENEEEEIIREREQSRSEAPTPDEMKKAQQQPPSEKQEDKEPEPFEEGTSKFIRLDDPETPYTEEEQMYLEEQERIYQQKYGDDGPPRQQEPSPKEMGAQAAQNLLNKRRREPLNQTAPQVQEGPLPSEQKMHRQPRVSKPEEDLSDMEIAEGYENTEPARLDRPRGQTSDQKSNSTKNPNFKGNK